MRSTLSLLSFAIRACMSRVTGRDTAPLRIPVRTRGAGNPLAHVWLFPAGHAVPGFAGGEEETDEEKRERELREQAQRDAGDGATQEEVDKAYAKLRTAEREKGEEQRAREAAERERDDLRRQLQQREQADQTDLERAQSENEELKGKIQAATDKTRRANLLVELAKPEHELVSPGAALKLIEGVAFDDDSDMPTNAKDRVEALLEQHGFLKAEPGKPTDTSDAHNAERQRQRDNHEMTSEEASRLAKDDPARFNELFEEGKIPASALQ